MRFPSQLLDLRIPLMFQNFLDGHLVIISSWEAIFKSTGNIFREIATIVCADGRGQPVYLFDLVADHAPLLESVCVVDGDGYVQGRRGEGETTNLLRDEY